MKILILAAIIASTCTPATPVQPPEPAPIVDAGMPTDAKAPVTGCAGAIENSRRLGCTFEADDAGGWCSTLTPAQVSCLAKAANCLATRQCAEMTK
jgi:hypothetical protein